MANEFQPTPMVHTLFGTLTAEQTGKSRATFSIADNNPRNGINPTTQKVRATFLDLVAFGQVGEHILTSMHKGDRFVGAGVPKSYVSTLNVLNAQTQLADTLQQLARARYDTLLAQLRLKAAAGTLGEDDVAAINALLVQ